MSASIEITPELLAGFLDEAPEYLEMLDVGLMDFESKAGSGILSLESAEDQEQMTTMFRAAHSLKGLAAAFGFDKIKELTHRMETLFDQLRMKQRKLTADAIETLFQVFDRLKILVKELADESVSPVDITDVLHALDRVLAARDESPPVEEVLADPELAAVFIETMVEAIDELNQGLLGLEENPADAELLNKVFRCAHNIKGASGAAGLKGMNRLTHEMETVFDQLRSGRLSLNDELMNAVFQAVDRLRAVIDPGRNGDIQDIAMDETRNLFERWMTPPDSPADVGVGRTEQVGVHVPEGSETQTTERTQEAALQPAESTSKTGSPIAGDGENNATWSGGGSGENLLAVTVVFPDGFSEAPIQAYLIHNKLSDLGSNVSSDPDIDSLMGDSDLNGIVFTFVTDAEPAEIEKLIRSYGVQSVVVSHAAPDARTGTKTDTPDAAGKSAPPGTTRRPSSAALTTGQEAGATPKGDKRAKKESRTASSTGIKTTATLRVDQERLDQLMNLGGELIINRARFTQIHKQFREVFNGKNLGYLVDDITDRLQQLSAQTEEWRGGGFQNSDVEELGSHFRHLKQSFNPVRSLVQRVHELRTSMFDFDEALHGLTRVSQGIQKGIMGTRMVPIGPLFTRFRRVIRDISKSNGKQVNLVLRGENTELDKRMIDELGDPLTHMVRNSVDHGIEMPEVRRAAGKDAAGTLILAAYHRGNSICIEVTDDGAGVNLEKVRAKIIDRELATPAQVEKMSNRELTQFIFKPGFSTAQTVTEVSGRGMGMDIVLNKLEKLSGTIDVDSTPGQGTRIVIRLPLTLAILTALVARIGKGVYAIPLEAVAEIITVRRETIRFIQRRQVVRVRDRVVPVNWFEDVFDTALPALQTATRKNDEITLVIVGFENDQIGLGVDELLGQEDVVIKSIAENFRNVRGIAGASIRGDGSVSLILDIAAMMEMTNKTVATDIERNTQPVSRKPEQPVPLLQG